MAADLAGASGSRYVAVRAGWVALSIARASRTAADGGGGVMDVDVRGGVYGIEFLRKLMMR